MKELSIFMQTLTERLLRDYSAENYPIGLAHGKMGGIVYLYHLHRYTGQDTYSETAGNLLDQLLESGMSVHDNLTVMDGLCGIGLGLEHLVTDQFIEGDLNELLKEIDDRLFKTVAFEEHSYTLAEMVHLIHYLVKRIKRQSDDENVFIYQELCIRLVSRIQHQWCSVLCKEPFAFSLYDYHVPAHLFVMAELIELDFYQSRLFHILEEMSHTLFAHLPHSHLNRLYLLWGELPLKDFSKDWEQHCDLLYENIRISTIMQKEIKGRNIYLSNGYSGLYWLLKNIEMRFPDYAFEYEPAQLYTCIDNSEAWKTLMEIPYYYEIHAGLLNGFPGAVLTMLDIKSACK